MLVASVVFAAAGAVLSGTLRTFTTVQATTSSNADLRVATEAISRSLRVAISPDGQNPSITYASAAELRFHSLLNRTATTTTTGGTTPTANPTALFMPTPTPVTYRWDGTCVTEQQGSGSPKCLLRTSVAPVFSYYATGMITPTSGGGSVSPLPISGGQLTPVQRAGVRSVQVSLVAKDPGTPGAKGVPATIRVTLQNVVYAAGEG